MLLKEKRRLQYGKRPLRAFKVLSANSTYDRLGRLPRKPRLFPSPNNMVNQQHIEASANTSNSTSITREQFMEFFRSDSFYEKVTDDDCREIFATVLKGASDLTTEFLNEILSDYSVGDVVAIKVESPSC